MVILILLFVEAIAILYLAQAIGKVHPFLLVKDGTVKIWTAATGALLHSLEGPAKEVEWVIWHPKGHAILAGWGRCITVHANHEIRTLFAFSSVGFYEMSCCVVVGTY